MATYLIKDVRLFDGVTVWDGLRTVYVSGGRVEHVGTADPANSSENATIIDGTGHTLLPGLIDAHVHVFRAEEELKSAIAAGVTTVFDMHNTPSNASYMKEISRRSNELPEVFSAFYAATIDGGWPRAIVRHTVKDPQVLVTDWQPGGLDADGLRFLQHYQTIPNWTRPSLQPLLWPNKSP